MPSRFEAQCQAIFDSTQDAIFLMHETRIEDCNAAALRMFGCGREQIIGHTPMDFSPEVQPDGQSTMIKVTEKLRLAMRGFSQRFEWRHRRLDRTEFDAEISLDTYRANGALVLLAIIRDISQRKQAEEAVRQRAEELATLSVLGRTVNASLSPREVASAAMEGLFNAICPSLAFLFMREGEKLVLKEMLPQSARERLAEFPEHRVGECLCGLAVRLNTALYCRNIFQDPRCTWDECKKAGMRSLAALPLANRGEVFGVVGLASDTERDFEKQSEFLETLASQVSTAFVNARLFETAQRELAQRVQAQEALRAREEQLLMLLKHAPAAIAMLDTDMRYLAVSDRFLDDYRLGNRDIIGMCHYDVFPEIRKMEDWLDIHRRCLAGERERREEDRFVRADGTVDWIKWELVPWRKADGSIGGIVMFTEVITQRKQVEEARRVGEEQVRQAAKVAGLGIFVHDHFTDKVMWSREMREICGWGLQDEIDLSGWVSFVHPDDRHRIAQAIQRAHDPSGDGLYAVEHRIVRLDGGVRWVSIRSQTSFAVRDGKSQPSQTIGAVLDITPSKQAQEALTRYSVDLEQSNKDLEQFAYVASHDLQEPLRMVTNFLELLREQCAPALDESGSEYLDFARDGATRMKDLLDGLLAYSRVSTRGKPPQATSVQAAVDAALANLRAGISETGASITCDPLPTINADPVQLTQLFQNLISNAIKFRGDRRPEVHIGASRQEAQWLFTVRDNGIGIDPQFHDRVFVIFQRLHTRQRFPGTGIGLSICRRIIERHGGRIWVQSAPGQGATFCFTIPESGRP